MTSLSLKKKNTSDLKLSLTNIYVFIIFEGVKQYVFQCFVCLPKTKYSQEETLTLEY